MLGCCGAVVGSGCCWECIHASRKLDNNKTVESHYSEIMCEIVCVCDTVISIVNLYWPMYLIPASAEVGVARRNVVIYQSSRTRLPGAPTDRPY